MTASRLTEIPLTIRKKSEISMNYYDIPDHPIIRNMERTGYPDGKEPAYPHCPCCHNECATVYLYDGEVIGCDVCLTGKDAYETMHVPDDHDAICPLCNELCETIYCNNTDDIVGCDACIDCKDAWDCTACFPDRD